MRTSFDFSPLYRSSIGFDHMIDLLGNTTNVESADKWPPYDIAKQGDGDYRITMAVAGFRRDELDVTLERNVLIVNGQKPPEDDVQYLHRGIAGRSFQRRFELADYVKVATATLENGLLTIDLKREIPEEMKPRRIRIEPGKTLADGNALKAEAPKQVS